MSSSNHAVFAPLGQESGSGSDWEVTSDVLSQEWADEESDREALEYEDADYEDIEYEGTEIEEADWEAPYLDVTEDASADEEHWDVQESGWLGEGSDWGAEAPNWEEDGPGYEEAYEEADWPSEAPDDVMQSRTGTVLISDYPRYATSVTDLDPQMVASVRSVANAIVGALATNHHVNVVVEGFADFDAKGRDFEQQVSIDRAISARTFLIDEVHRRAQATGLSQSALRRLSTQSAAFGSRRPSVRYPRAEDERRQNRRVHIVWNVIPVPPQKVPPFEEIVKRAERAIESVQKQGPRRRLSCLLTKLKDSRVADGYFSYDALKMFPGSAGWPAMTPDQFDQMVQSTTVHARHQIQSIALAARNEADMATQLETLDDNIGRNIFNFEQQMVGDSTTGVLIRTFNATIGRLQSDPNSILSCYSVYSRVRHDQ